MQKPPSGAAILPRHSPTSVAIAVKNRCRRSAGSSPITHRWRPASPKPSVLHWPSILCLDSSNLCRAKNAPMNSNQIQPGDANRRHTVLGNNFLPVTRFNVDSKYAHQFRCKMIAYRRKAGKRIVPTHHYTVQQPLRVPVLNTCSSSGGGFFINHIERGVIPVSLLWMEINQKKHFLILSHHHVRPQNGRI